jgi:hypothetical protein
MIMPQVQVLKSLKFFTNDVKLEILHQSREKFKINFYGHSYHRGSDNLAKLAPDADFSEIPSQSFALSIK